MKVYFQAVFYVDKEDSTWINVKLVDILGAFTCGVGYEDAVFMAKDCLTCMLDSKNVLHRFSSYEKAKRMCDEDCWIELLQIDLPEQTVKKEGIFSTNIDNYFPSQEAKTENEEIKKQNLNL